MKLKKYGVIYLKWITLQNINGGKHMACYGLSNPWIAKLDTEKETYSNGFKCGAAVETNVNPQYNEANLYGDNQLQETAKEFKYADVTLGVTHLPIQTADVMFGHTVKDNNITYKTSDVANYVGYGFYASERVAGKTKYIAAVLPKVLFAEAEDSYTTKGDNIEFKTPSLTGRAMAVSNGTWREKETFETEEEAVTWIKTKLNITEVATTSTTSSK